MSKTEKETMISAPHLVPTGGVPRVATHDPITEKRAFDVAPLTEDKSRVVPLMEDKSKVIPMTVDGGLDRVPSLPTHDPFFGSSWGTPEQKPDIWWASETGPKIPDASPQSTPSKELTEAIEAAFGSKAEPKKRKHSHYFKDVSDLDFIDVYRVLALFNVTDPCLQHAVKKLLVAGGRGVKDIRKDVQEAIDTCVRFIEMRKEEDAAGV